VRAPAFYARPGSVGGDLVTVLHLPYTAWHLSYVAIGAALASPFDPLRMAGTLLAFFLGTGIAAHALDEYRGRPLATSLSNRVLLGLGWGGMAGALAVAVAGAVRISPWVLAWAAAGVVMAAGYALEWPRWLHTDAGFAIAWGGFPTLVGYWAQAERLTLAVLVVAGAGALLAAAQRALSTPARDLRRRAQGAVVHVDRGSGTETWPTERLLATWERPLKLLSWMVVVLAVGLVASRL
jgi:hypothetical protein